MGTDHVFLERLVVWSRIGIGDLERSVPQELEIALDLEVDTRDAVESDAIEDTVDYMTVAEQVRVLATSGEHRLVETLAQRIADRVLADPRVIRVRVEVRKRAPALPGANARAGVALVRPWP